MNIQDHLKLLGMKVEDRVTGLTGVVCSVCFDLYGCIQAVVNPGLDKDGKLKDQLYFDVNRLRVISDDPVMVVPDFVKPGPQSEGRQGPADKPAFNKA